MPRIWFKDKVGRTFHITVETASWEGDYNTPATAKTIPVAIFSSNLCMNTITFTTPEGAFTINFDVNGRTGSCNQCGQCCSHPIASCPHPGNCGYIVAGAFHKCSHLVVKGPGIGKKRGTECDIHMSLMYEGLKGCVLSPAVPSDIAPWVTNCGFRFS